MKSDSLLQLLSVSGQLAVIGENLLSKRRQPAKITINLDIYEAEEDDSVEVAVPVRGLY